MPPSWASNGSPGLPDASPAPTQASSSALLIIGSSRPRSPSFSLCRTGFLGTSQADVFRWARSNLRAQVNALPVALEDRYLYFPKTPAWWEAAHWVLLILPQLRRWLGCIDCAHVELRAPSGEGSICVTLGWDGGCTGGVESSANGGCQKHQNSHVYRLPKGKANYSNYAGCGNTDISIPAILPRDYFLWV